MKYDYSSVQKTADKHEYKVTIPHGELAAYEERAFNKLAKDVKIDGFRPGKAPREKVMQKVGSQVTIEAINMLLPEVAFEIMQKEEARPTGSPSYDLEKIEEKDGIVFTFSFVNYPDVELGDFSKISVKKEEPKVTEDDIDMVIKNAIRQSLGKEKIVELTKVTEKKTKKSSKKSSTEKDTAEPAQDETPEYDFELNDAVVEALQYEETKDLQAMRDLVRERLISVREEQTDRDYTQAVLEKAIDVSSFEIPVSFVESELKMMEADFMDRLKELNLDIETFLASQGTTIEKKREEWEAQAKQKVGRDLVLITIANEHKAVASDEDIDKEIQSISDPQVRKSYESDSAREYVRTIITRQRGMEKLLEMVEGEKKKESKETKKK